MWIRLLKLGARYPLTLLAVGLTLLLGALATPIVLLATRQHRQHHCHAQLANHRAQVEGTAADGNPRQLIGRYWLDRLPDKPRDEIDLILFFGSGFGVYEHGSRYKASLEFFEFERAGDKVDVTFFQDKK